MPKGINSEVLERDNSNEDPSWRQKELIPSCQRENVAPTEFEIQIWVLNFGRRVQYSKILMHGFPFVRLTFPLIRKSGKKKDVCYDLKKENKQTGNIPVIWGVCLILTRYQHSYSSVLSMAS